PSRASLPTLFGIEQGLYPVLSRSFMASVTAHLVLVALLATFTIWAAPSFHERPKVSSMLVTDVGSYVWPAAPGRMGGGGGGGDNDKMEASKGTPPRFERNQIAPPAIVVRNEDPRLPTEPTVVGPPSIVLSQDGPTGDLFSRTMGPPSNGVGSEGGIGSGER